MSPEEIERFNHQPRYQRYPKMSGNASQPLGAVLRILGVAVPLVVVVAALWFGVNSVARYRQRQEARRAQEQREFQEAAKKRRQEQLAQNEANERLQAAERAAQERRRVEQEAATIRLMEQQEAASQRLERENQLLAAQRAQLAAERTRLAAGPLPAPSVGLTSVLDAQRQARLEKDRKEVERAQRNVWFNQKKITDIQLEISKAKTSSDAYGAQASIGYYRHSLEVEQAALLRAQRQLDLDSH